MANSTLTLERERVMQIQSLDLIGDGPNEVASQLITQFRQANQETKLKQKEVFLATKEKTLRQNFAEAFIEQYTNIFNITKNQMAELVYRGIKEENIQFIEGSLVERLRRRAWSWIGASVISGGVCIYGIANLFINDNVRSWLLIFVPFGWIMPAFILTALLSDVGFAGYFEGISYIQTRKRLKKKYGSNYFPIQELRQELELHDE